MNWGQKLIMVFVVFASGMIYLAYRCMHVSTELVSKEYYKDELRYQDVIDATRTANALSERVKLIQHDGAITIQLPAEMKNQKVAGTIWFYCASDATLDRHIRVDINSQTCQQINKTLLSPGFYTVKFDWTSNNKHYYTEQSLTIL
jgi:hypothetical protein